MAEFNRWRPVLSLVAVFMFAVAVSSELADRLMPGTLWRYLLGFALWGGIMGGGLVFQVFVEQLRDAWRKAVA
jgi:hypothetical protein